MDQVLKGVCVLDFGRFIAAPWCAALLGDLGADVIRVERREGGEDRYVMPISSTGDGAMFIQCNRNKLSLTLDMQTPEGAEIKRRLVAKADVVVVNLPEITMNAIGLDYESLKAIKPDIIHANGTAYGVGGPYSERVGFDGIGQAIAGGLYRSGNAEQPMRSAAPYADFGTALNMALGTVAALLHRNRTGQGQKVEGSLLASALMMTNIMVMEQAVTKPNRVGIGNRSPLAAPADLYRVTDGWIFAQVVGQAQFKRWCNMVERDDWFSDARFLSDEHRSTNEGVLNDRMAAWCVERSQAEALALLEGARIPASPVHSPQQVLDDPHIQAMGFYKPSDYPGLPHAAPVIETPFRMSLSPGTIRMRAPEVGEHTNQILEKLGYSASEITNLRERKII